MVSKEKQREMRLSHHLSSIRTGRMPSNIQSSLVSYSDIFLTFFIPKTIKINTVISTTFIIFVSIKLQKCLPDNPSLRLYPSLLR